MMEKLNTPLSGAEARHDFSAASSQQFAAMLSLLKDAGLPTDDLLPAKLADFELALDPEGKLVGIAGLEVIGGDALLRSIVVTPAWRGKGLGERLVARREDAARTDRARAIYLLTTSSDAFFRHRGYIELSRAEVPPVIAAHAQFRSLCPASAKCLRKEL